MAATTDPVGKTSLFRRGLNATRFALAFAVTVVIVTVVVYAFIVASRMEQLDLTVAGGIMHVRPLDNPKLLGLTFSVRANNPSGRVRFYYTNIHAHLLLKNGMDNVTLASFLLGANPNMDVAPVSMLQTDADVNMIWYEKISTYFNDLRDNSSSSIISGATLKLNGTLTVGVYSVHNRTIDHPIFYYCSPLTIGAASNTSADAAEDDVLCKNFDPTK